MSVILTQISIFYRSPIKFPSKESEKDKRLSFNQKRKTMAIFIRKHIYNAPAFCKITVRFATDGSR